jgi:hypothetical protein
MAQTRNIDIDSPSRPVGDQTRHISDDEPTMTPVNRNEARQAVSGQGASNVLLWSVLAVVIAFVIVYFAFFA